MKKLLLALLLLPLQLFAGTVTLAWNADPDARVTEYKIYYSATPGGPYLSSVIVSPVPPSIVVPTQVTVPGLTDGQTYYFVATAVDVADSLESIFSTEVSTKIPFLPLPQVTGLKVVATTP